MTGFGSRDSERQGACICPWVERPMGRLHGVDHGHGVMRLSTTKGCPEHDSCHRWTAERRAERSAEHPWSNPYCPIHATRNCPKETP